MDTLLCDELIQEIFQKLPPSSSSSAPLVSKRWLCLYRSSRTSLSLRLSLLDSSAFASLSSLLSRSPSLSSLRLLRPSAADGGDDSSRRLLHLVAAACPRLTSFRYSAGPVSAAALLHLSTACTHLTSLNVSLPRPLCLTWVARFPNLKELSVAVAPGSWAEEGEEHGSCSGEDSAADLGLETVALSGVESGDLGLNWLWRSCKKMKKLKLRNCESIGDEGPFSSFVSSLTNLEEVELRTSRTIIDPILSKLAANCESLTSLLIYDGGSREGLLQFIRNCRSDLQKLDFRLPLDLKNDHLSAAAANFPNLSTLRLQSCCLVTGEGLKALGLARSSGLRELALINCDVVEREPGLLATLGQSLRALTKLDLSFNDHLLDLEFVSMMASCNDLIDLKLRGCNGLTNSAIAALSKCCPLLQNVDITNCIGIKAQAVEFYVQNSQHLRKIEVEESKVSDAAKIWASDKFIEMGT